jgi:hypothetical protein
MTDRLAPASGAMEGRGAYNRHAKIQASGVALAQLHLASAIETMPLESSGEGPIVIVDYGSSQGKNSLGPLHTAIEAIRQRVGGERPILVYHEDLPVNDFNALFDVLHNDPDSYALNQPNVFPCAIGRSFYEEILPPSSVDLGWSSYAAMWLSRVPTPIPGHFYIARGGGKTRAAFERQAAQDWERFLSLRSKELRPGGRFVLSVPAGHHDGSTGFEELMDLANATLADMVAEGIVATDERARMVHGALLRPLRDLLAPFAREPHFAGLTVEHSEVHPVPDAAWAAFEQDGGKEALASARTSFFRVTYAPTLAGALADAGDAERRRGFFDRLESGLKRRLLNVPAPIKSLIATMVLAKGEAA